MNDDKDIELAKEAIKQSFETAKEFVGKLVNPVLETLTRIAKVLNVSVDKLIN